MSFSWKQYEGQVINNTFPLQRYLGGSSESAVFLTQLAGPQSSKAVLKLVPESVSADLQLSLWRRASKLTHPNLLQLFQGGRCRLADMDLLYVVMEYAEENLSEILPQRALTPAEARDMLGPVLDALSDLHAQGLVHSHLKPSNVLATSDQVKLSTDRLFPAGEIRTSTTKRTVYDAPETVNQALTPASDVWSLGVMLIEVLTQRVPTGQHGSPSADSLPHPFREIAHHALQDDPRLRWTVAQIAASMNPLAAAAAQSASPLSVPFSTVPPVPAARIQASKPAHITPPPAPFVPPPPPSAPAPRRPLFAPRAKAPVAPAPPLPVMPPLVPPLERGPVAAPPVIPPPVMPPLVPPLSRPPAPMPMKVGGAKRDIVLPSFVIPLAVALLVVAGIIALPKFLSRGVESSPAPATKTSVARGVAPGPEAQPSDTELPRSTKPNSSASAKDSLKSAAAKPSAKESSQPAAASTAPAALRSETKPSADASKSSATGSGSASGRAEVLDQVLPEIPDKALATISGKVRVILRAHVDAAGNVAGAEFENPGPSQYFADASMKALRRWEFTSPEANGRSMPSEWLVRFEFTSSGVQAFPKQITP